MRASELMRTNFLAVSIDDTVHSVLGKLQRGKHHSAVVVDSRDRYLGLFDKDGCLRSRGDLGEMKVRHVLRKTSKLEESTDITRVAQLLHAADTHILPVLDKYKRVAGIVGARDVLVALMDKLRGTRVSDVAAKYPLVLTESDSVAKAIELIRRKKISRIPVIDEKKKLVGIVTRFDLVRDFMLKPVPSRGGGKAGWRQASSVPVQTVPSSSNITVGNVMMKLVQTIAPSALVQAAVRKMSEANVSDLVVVEDGAPVGMLTTKDLLRRVA